MADHSPLPVVLVGCGAVSQLFYLPTLRALSQRAELRVHALVDPVAAARNHLAPAFPQAQQADSLSQVNAPEGTLAIIATPPRFHQPQTLDCLQKGWHVLCEKPMASGSTECQQMIDAAADARRLLAVGLYKRFFPSSAYLKSLISGGQLGALISYTISEGGPFRWPAASPSFFNKAQTPGGVLLDIGVHVLDLLIWWLGEPASYHYSDDAMGGLETNARLELTHSGGARGLVRLSRDWATTNQYRFVFERGLVTWKVNDANGITVQIGGTPAGLRSTLVNPMDASTPEFSIQAAHTNPQSFIQQLRNVAAAIRGEEPLLVPGEEGVRSLRFIEACYAGRALLAQPWFTPEEAARAAQLAAS